MAGSLRKSIQNALIRSRGEEFFITRTLTSSNITTTAKNFSTTPSGSGRIAIYDVIFKTDATGLAGGTNFVISTTNAKGQTNVAVETVANLGANKTTSIQNPKSQHSVTAQPTILEAGQTIQYNSTVGACTGAGTVDVWILCQRVDDNADLSVSNA